MENFTRNTQSEPVLMPDGLRADFHMSQLPRNPESDTPKTPERKVTDLDIARSRGRHVYHLRLQLANGQEVVLDTRSNADSGQAYELTGENQRWVSLKKQ